MTDMNESIMKADRRGRLRYPPEQNGEQSPIEAYEGSRRRAQRPEESIKCSATSGWKRRRFTRSSTSTTGGTIFRRQQTRRVEIFLRAPDLAL